MVTGIDTAVPYELSPNDVLTVSGIGTDDRAQSLTGGFTSVLSAKVVNSFRVFRNWVDTSHPGPKYFGPQDVGINAYSYVDKSLPLLVPGAFSLGAPSNFISDLVDTHGNYGVSDDVTTVRGRTRSRLAETSCVRLSIPRRTRGPEASISLRPCSRDWRWPTS